MDFNLEYYKAFYFAAKYNSFSKAAKALYLSQPAISHSIRRLEKALSCTLFFRTAHGMALTPEGKLLFRHVEKAFSILESGQEKLSRFTDLDEQDICIGTTETGLFHYVFPRLPDFQRHHPNVKLHIQGCHSIELLQMLKDGSIDVAIGVTPVAVDPSISLIPLQDFQDVFICTDHFPHLIGRSVTPQELLQFPLVMASTGSSFAANLEQWFAQQQLTLKPQFSVLTTSFIRPFVESGIAVGCVPDFFAKQWHKSTPAIESITLTRNPPKRSIFIATNDAMPIQDISLDFIKLLQGTGNHQNE